MNWGKGIAMALFSFAVMMAWFMVKAAQNPEPLVTEDYYAEELRFQSRIDGTARARALSTAVAMNVQQRNIKLTFPKELDGQHITGSIHLLRPNAPAADRTMPFASDTNVVEVAGYELLTGRYNVALRWTSDETEYFTEEKVFVP